MLQKVIPHWVRREPRGIRLTLAIGEFCWAIMLLWPGDTFSRPTYNHMKLVMNEEMWGLLFLWSGVTQVSIVMINCLQDKFARIFSGWNAVLWCYVVWSMVASVYPPPAAIGGEFAIACSALWLVFRPWLFKYWPVQVTRLEAGVSDFGDPK